MFRTGDIVRVAAPGNGTLRDGHKVGDTAVVQRNYLGTCGSALVWTGEGVTEYIFFARELELVPPAPDLAAELAASRALVAELGAALDRFSTYTIDEMRETDGYVPDEMLAEIDAALAKARRQP